jgi:predicted nucleic acid-binding protein
LVLLDTDVTIEVQRGRAAAAAWLGSRHSEVAIPAPVALELLIGSRDSKERARTRRILPRFEVEEAQPSDSATAQMLIVAHSLACGLGLPDYLIAAQALTRQSTLYTFNREHYASVPELDSQITLHALTALGS